MLRWPAVFLWLFAVTCWLCSAKRFSQLALHTETEKVNGDRLSCLRQDNLDLVAADEDQGYILRKVFGTGDSTDNDVYIFAEQLKINDFRAALTIKRAEPDLIEFDLSGNEEFNGNKGVGQADLWLSGFKVMTQSSLISWAAYLAANQEVLKEGQTGTLHFSLQGTARAVWNQTTVRWDVELVSTNVKVFQFKFDRQMILETALNKFGGIDQLILDNMFNVIKSILPPSLVSAMSYLPLRNDRGEDEQDLWFRTAVSLSGAMQVPNGELSLKAKLMVKASFVPAVLFQTFQKFFDVTEIAKEKVAHFLEDPEVHKLWRENRAGLEQTLRDYQLLAGKEIFDLVRDAKELDSLRPILLKAAMKLADNFNRLMQLLIAATSSAIKTGCFQGLEIQLKGNASWDKNVNGGCMSVQLQPAQTGQPDAVNDMSSEAAASDVRAITLPLALLDVLGLSGKLHRPPEGITTIGIRDFALKSSSVEVSQVTFNNLLTSLGGNESEASDDTKLWEIEAARLADVRLRFPKSVDLPFQITSKHWQSALLPSGEFTVSGASEGFHFQQTKILDLSDMRGKQRDGSVDSLDGKVPSNLQRPSEPKPDTSRMRVAPSATGLVSLGLVGNQSSLVSEFHADLQVQVEVAPLLQAVLAPRPSEDFGYLHFVHDVERRIENGEENLESRSTVTAVLSCGFLRLFEKPLREDLLARIDMRPSRGQLLLDLTEYKDAPTTEPDPDGNAGKSCLRLYSSGYMPRKVGSWLAKKEVVELLCGPKEVIEELQQAMKIQVARFQDPRAEKWNYGTHPADEPQYKLPSGLVSKSLEAILRSPPQLLKHQSSTAFFQKADATLDSIQTDKVAARILAKPSAKVQQNFDSSHREDRASFLQSSRERSKDSLQCRVRERLDMKYYPPENFGHASFRHAFAATPLGDVYIMIDKLQLMNIDLELKLQRQSDTTFMFEIQGPQGENQGFVDMWVEGISVETPDSPLNFIAQALAEVEDIVSTVVSLGFRRVRLDRGTLRARVYMAGEFQLSEGGHWDVRPGAASKAAIWFEGGGIISAFVNQLLKSFGGLDKVFLDRIWPLLASLIPEKVGDAFTAVKLREGQLGTQLHIKGGCKAPEGRRCPSGEVELSVDQKSFTFLTPIPITKAYLAVQEKHCSNCNSDECRGRCTPGNETWAIWVHQNIVSASEKGMTVFGGINATVSVSSSYKQGEPLTGQLKARNELPIGFFESVVGSSSLLLHFLPELPNELAAVGSLAVEDNTITVPKIRLKNIRLPFFSKEALDGGTEAFELNVTLEELRARPPGEDSSIVKSIVGNIDLRADRKSGLNLQSLDSTPKGATFSFDLTEKGVQDLLDKPTAGWLQTNIVRTRGESKADGALPKRLQRRFASMPTKIDLNRILKDADLQIVAGVSGETDLQEEEADGFLNVTSIVTLRIDNAFWQSLLGRFEPDFGFVHFSMPGYYKLDGLFEEAGQLKEVAPALADMSCGLFIIYRLDKDMYQDEVARFELADGTFQPKFENGCLYLKSEWIVWVENKKYFCADPSDMRVLEEALTIQFERFKNTEDAADAAKIADKEGAKAAKEAGFGLPHDFLGDKVTVLPDTTWFRRLNPYDTSSWYPRSVPPESPSDIESPLQRWRSARHQMNLTVGEVDDRNVEDVELEEEKKNSPPPPKSWPSLSESDSQ